MTRLSIKIAELILIRPAPRRAFPSVWEVPAGSRARGRGAVSVCFVKQAVPRSLGVLPGGASGLVGWPRTVTDLGAVPRLESQP